MARVNIGINPRFISDQHLIAESVEITMITGQLRAHGYKIKGKIPKKFSLGTGHMTFFKDKLLYLQKRLYEVNCELLRRGFEPSTNINLNEFPIELRNDWNPSESESILVRLRVAERLLTPLKAKSGFHKYKRHPIPDLKSFSENIIKHKLSEV